MASRRSCRAYLGASLSRRDISTLLYCALGFQGLTTDPLVGALPLKMTPSGGALCPYDCYLLVQHVDELKPGIYLYDPVAHDLARKGEYSPHSVTALLAGQTWVENASVIVILVGRLFRTMWKYRHTNAFNVLLIEAGHIGQNLLLMASHLGHAACPTAAFDFAAISSLLGIDNLVDLPVYAIAIGSTSEAARSDHFVDQEQQSVC
jgi:SagB-type dehydrogenase family enzyme